MSIQQAMNNMLFSAQIGAGLYAQSPAVKNKTKIKEKETAIRAENRKADLETEALAGEVGKNKNFEKSYYARTKRIAKLHEEMFELNPTEKRYQSYLNAVKEKEEAKKQYKDRVKFLKEHEKNKLRLKDKNVYLNEKSVKGTYKLGGKE